MSVERWSCCSAATPAATPGSLARCGARCAATTGYTAASPPVRWLVEVLGELDAAQRRAFLSFATGAPRLPPGGFAALRPPLTVVRKSPAPGGPLGGATPPNSFSNAYASTPPSSLDPGTPTHAQLAADATLPSVMTCANYIKLPPYSSKEVLRARLLFALEEGQGSFDLS
ncbi:hypothetical protein QBZ16_002353 [Prototheca wickerhamii]|uniref:HECT domain-containing protein n=1 Tax=Prototheca wickerhamii TaxID=3111 RepID=A0AAD9IKG1_PROWI|nr:hypothetical protein QBZ16_002353 [Prototheca wickerhamii]